MYMSSKFETRNISEHMIWSHIFLILPCIYWVFMSNHGPWISHVFDKIMSVTLTISITLSILFHYYYEEILCDVEYQANILGIVLLNIYMIYRQVPWIAIVFGFCIVFALGCNVEQCSKQVDKCFFETYHPFCHYIAGVYVAYCVYFIEQSFIIKESSYTAENTDI